MDSENGAPLLALVSESTSPERSGHGSWSGNSAPRSGHSTAKNALSWKYLNSAQVSADRQQCLGNGRSDAGVALEVVDSQAQHLQFSSFEMAAQMH